MNTLNIADYLAILGLVRLIENNLKIAYLYISVHIFLFFWFTI